MTSESVKKDKFKIKEFYRWMIEVLGSANWSMRRGRLLETIRMAEVSIDLTKPIESQLYRPPEQDIDWFILVAELAWDYPYSDCAYESKQVYPYAMSIGECVEALRQSPGIEPVLKKMLANRTSPENQLFEILTAAHYIKNGYEVDFIPEHSLTRSDGSKKSPDLLVKRGEALYVECKRAARQTQYSKDEETAWGKLWEVLNVHMLATTPWAIANVTFHTVIEDISPLELIHAYDAAFRSGGELYKTDRLSVSARPIDRMSLVDHYDNFSVRPRSPQHELLVFGDIDANEKRSIATIARKIVRPGDKDTVLNIFVQEVASCVAAQWKCDHQISVVKRAKHFKTLMADAISQIPPDSPGIVHILYDTREGIDIEYLRRTKNIESIAEYDASDTLVLGVLIHAVNYYPKIDDYDWAETVQDFARFPNFLDMFYSQPLMLGSDNTIFSEHTTHWEQDARAKS